MSIRSRFRRCAPAAGLVLWAALVPPASGGPAPPDAREVAEKVRERFGRIEDYRVQVGVHVEIEGFDFPDQQIEILYKKPDRVRVEGAGLATLPREGVMADPSRIIDEEQFDIRLAGVDTVQGRTAYRLDLFSRDGESEAGPDLVAWVDAERWVILRMEAYKSGTQQGSVTFEQRLVQGKFWLPHRTDVEVYMQSLPMRPPAAGDRDSTSSRQPDRGTIHLVFGDYQVNAGLPDSLFADP